MKTELQAIAAVFPNVEHLVRHLSFPSGMCGQMCRQSYEPRFVASFGRLETVECVQEYNDGGGVVESVLSRWMSSVRGGRYGGWVGWRKMLERRGRRMGRALVRRRSLEDDSQAERKVQRLS